MGILDFRGKRVRNSGVLSTLGSVGISPRWLCLRAAGRPACCRSPLTRSTGPTLTGAYNVPSGKDLYVPLTASDPGQTITYSASTTNSQVTTTVLTGNPELLLNVSGTDANGQAFSGTLRSPCSRTFAPQTVAAIIQDVNNGIYTNSSFYRMETAQVSN